MQLLLLEDVRKLGHLGDIVTVRPGYARNYLIPQGLATEPTEENIAAIADAKKAAAAERAKRLKQFQALADKLQDVSVTIEAQANPEGTLYGSVGAREIAKALQEQGHPVDTEHVHLDGPIRTVDNRTVTIEFTDDVTVDIKVWVVREGGALEDELAEDDADGSEADEQLDAPVEEL